MQPLGKDDRPTSEEALVEDVFDAPTRRAFRRRLLAWYQRCARDLPWRRTRDPYQVWVSEIMLQQTQVATVRTYFSRFITRFPTVSALAEAPEADVLKLWEGLGYYRRARQMHRAARVVVEEHGGRFPRDMDAVRRLPGIGRYTAGAILSIAFDDPQPIVEANTARLYARLLAHEGDLDTAAGQRVLWTLAERLVPRRGAGAFNQALMELGGQVCSPREPLCDDCPAALFCRCRSRGKQSSIPRSRRQPKVEAVREAAVVVRRRKTLLLLRSTDKGRWQGLWDFPRFAINGDHGPALRQMLAGRVVEMTGAVIKPGEKLVTLKHSVTRYRITLDCYLAAYASGARQSNDLRWVPFDELDALPLNVTARRLARLAVERLGTVKR